MVRETGRDVRLEGWPGLDVQVTKWWIRRWKRIQCFTVVGPARFTPGLASRQTYIDEEVN